MMAGDRKKIANTSQGEVGGGISGTERGALQAGRLRQVVSALKERLRPSDGLRPGRPTNAEGGHHPKVPMSEKTARELCKPAQHVSSEDRNVSPMEVAAHLLEDAVASYAED